MTRDEITDLIQATLNELLRLNGTKGKEYSGNEDALSNFKRAGERRGLHPMDALMIYMDKHLDAINTYVRNVSRHGMHPGQELSEPISGRIDDAILYLILLKGLIYDTTLSMVSHRDGCIDTDRHGGGPGNSTVGVSSVRNPNPDELSRWDSPHLHRSVHPERHGRP